MASRPNFYDLGLEGPGLGIGLRAALAIFGHHPQTQDTTTAAKIKLKARS